MAESGNYLLAQEMRERQTKGKERSLDQGDRAAAYDSGNHDSRLVLLNE
jgi:hypothetical protein